MSCQAVPGDSLCVLYTVPCARADLLTTSCDESFANCSRPALRRRSERNMVKERERWREKGDGSGKGRRTETGSVGLVGASVMPKRGEGRLPCHRRDEGGSTCSPPGACGYDY